MIRPASTTQLRTADDTLANAGNTQGAIRLLIGMEDRNFLTDDFKRAFQGGEKNNPAAPVTRCQRPRRLLLHRQQFLRDRYKQAVC